MRKNHKVMSMRTELSQARAFAKSLERAVREMSLQRESTPQARCCEQARKNLAASISMLRRRLREVSSRIEHITRELRRFERFERFQG